MISFKLYMVSQSFIIFFSFFFLFFHFCQVLWGCYVNYTPITHTAVKMVSAEDEKDIDWIPHTTNIKDRFDYTHLKGNSQSYLCIFCHSLIFLSYKMLNKFILWHIHLYSLDSTNISSVKSLNFTYIADAKPPLLTILLC